MKKTNLNNKIISIERRFLEEIFNCKYEQLEKVYNLIRAIEEEFKYDLVKKLLSMVSEHEQHFSLSYEIDTCGSLLDLVIMEFFCQYFIRMGIPEESEIFELLCEYLPDVPNYTYITPETPLGSRRISIEV